MQHTLMTKCVHKIFFSPISHARHRRLRPVGRKGFQAVTETKHPTLPEAHHLQPFLNDRGSLYSSPSMLSLHSLGREETEVSGVYSTL